MSHIFISYSRRDTVCVDKVVHRLEENDFPVWIDRQKIALTSEFPQEITNNILSARLFVLFWSENAKASPYVEAERRIANQQYLAGKLKILPIMLEKDEKFELPIEFAHIQAADFRSGCDDTAIGSFIDQIPSDLRKFSYDKPLGQQPYQSVEGTSFVSVPYLSSTSGRCSAYIVGRKDAKMPRAPRELVICLQFMQPTNKNMLKEVYETLDDSEAWMLHITGPVVKDSRGDKYWIDNLDRALWEECYQFTTQMIQSNARSDTTKLKFFGLTAGVLLARIAMGFYRFWSLQFYNYASESGKPYVLAYEVDRNGNSV